MQGASLRDVEDLGAPSSYLALDEGADVYTCDGKRIGKVEHVLAVPEKDIFDGIVLDTSVLPGGHRFVDAPEVEEIFERGVLLKIDREQADSLPEPGANPFTRGNAGGLPSLLSFTLTLFGTVILAGEVTAVPPGSQLVPLSRLN